MKKICICGNVLSNVTVPNDIIYEAYLEEEWKNQLIQILGGPIYKFIRPIWYCKECDRFYYFSVHDKKYYIYHVNNEAIMRKYCCDGKLHQGKLLNIYCYNDFESYKIENQIKNGERPIFPSKVQLCQQCKNIYIEKEGNLKVYVVEEEVTKF